MKNSEQITKEIEERIEVLCRARQIIGTDGFSKEGEQKIAALNLLWKQAEFTETIEELKAKVENSETDEEVKTLAMKFIKYGLKL